MLYITRACRCRAHSYAHVHPPFEPWDTGPIKPETPKQQIEKEENPTMSPTSHYEPKEWGNPPEGLQPTGATVRSVLLLHFFSDHWSAEPCQLDGYQPP